MSNQQLYNKAKQILAENCPNIDWDDLADTNSLWDYIDEDMSEDNLTNAVYEAISDRITEDDTAQICGITIDDVWGNKGI